MLDVATEEKIRFQAKNPDDDDTKSVFTAVLCPYHIVASVTNNSPINPEITTDEQWAALNFDNDLTPKELENNRSITQNHRQLLRWTIILLLF